jgi:hypothetical protein
VNVESGTTSLIDGRDSGRSGVSHVTDYSRVTYNLLTIRTKPAAGREMAGLG